MPTPWTLIALSACADLRNGSGDLGASYQEATLDVAETLVFTDVPYTFTGPTQIADLPLAAEFGTLFPSGAELPACDGWSTSPSLPATIEGIVTVLPRVYFKADGCIPTDDDAESDQKYYGSTFVQDASGALFTLGDAKLPPFQVADRVRLNVTSVGLAYDLPRITAYEVEAIVEHDVPIAYEVVEGPLGPAQVASVVRVAGTVTVAPDGFGETHLTNAAGDDIVLSLDAELTRRGFTLDVGDAVTVTGPVLYAYSTYTIVVMMLGQIEVQPPETL